MKKQIITLAVTGLLLSSCGIYTKYEPVTSIPRPALWRGSSDRDTVSLVIWIGGNSSPILICNPSLKWDCQTQY